MHMFIIIFIQVKGAKAGNDEKDMSKERAAKALMKKEVTQCRHQNALLAPTHCRHQCTVGTNAVLAPVQCWHEHCWHQHTGGTNAVLAPMQCWH